MKTKGVCKTPTKLHAKNCSRLENKSTLAMYSILFFACHCIYTKKMKGREVFIGGMVLHITESFVSGTQEANIGRIGYPPPSITTMQADFSLFDI
jgi:hypothetical protein